MTKHRALPTDDVAEAGQWGILSGFVWAAVAFYVPQYLLSPLFERIVTLPINRNTQQFLIQGIAETAAIFALWFIMKKFYRQGLRSLGLTKVDPGVVSWAVLAFPLYLIVSIVLTSLIGSIFSVDLNQTQNIGYANPSGYELGLIFVALVLLAPFVEEVLFRGFLFSAFRRRLGFWGGAIIVSLLFALAHMQLNVGLDVFVLSMFLCYLREKTGNLWPSIAMHGLKNLVAFIILFIIHVK